MAAPKYLRFWMQFFSNLDQQGISGEIMVPSIFRNESNPSMSINVETGFWKDFGDESIGSRQRADGSYSNGGGDAIRFIEELYGVPFQIAKKVVEEILVGKEPILPIPHEYIMQLHQNLMSNEPVLEAYMNKRGFNRNVIEKYYVGWDPKLQRITIPIMNAHGYWVNIRKYSMTKSDMKMINHARTKGEGGYGQSRLFPIRNLFKSDKVVIFEGEHDALLAIQLGIRAITSTGGASVFPKDAEDYFYGKTVYLCYDNDHQGRSGMEKVAARLSGIAESIYLCPKFPLESPSNADFTDYIRAGFTREDFADDLLKKATLYTGKQQADVAPISSSDMDYEPISLAESLDPGWQDKAIQVESLVVGKGKQPFTIEKNIKFTCAKMNPDAQKCQVCGIFAANGLLQAELNPSSDTLLFIKAHSNTKRNAIKQIAKVPKACDLFETKVDEWQNVEELMISPQVQTVKAPGAISGDTHFHQTAFHMYPTKTTRIETNRSYLMKGIRTTDPWQQNTAFIVLDAEPVQSNIETFKLTDELKEQLKVFQVRPGQSIAEKFDEIHADIEYNVTKIFGRRDLMTAYDLVYHSALRFVFQHKVEHKGWLEVLVIGDTRTGKSETAQWMAFHYGLGDYGAGEASTLAGLLGGLQQGSGGTNWMLTWGKIPLNDRGLYTIDEVSGLSVEDIGQLSGIRSLGIAELTKIRQEKTNARTRLIWISNPRKGKSLDEFEYGCEAIPALIGANEDIARFDLAVTAASGEVPESEINKDIMERDAIPHVYTSALCHNLVLWGWSRNLGNLAKNNQVIFEPEAEALVLKYATQFSKKYSSKIPLVEGANHRIKLAKMAVAAAIRVFSTDNGENVIVTKDHVEFVAQAQMAAYDKTSMGYGAYSEKIFEQSNMSKSDEDAIMIYLSANPELMDAFKLLRIFSFQQLQQITGYEPLLLREHIHWLADKKIIRVKSNGQWTFTTSGQALLRKLRG